jgi:hypothetical protein
VEVLADATGADVSARTIAALTALGIDRTMKCPPFLTVQEMEALPEEGKEARLIHQVMQLQKFIIQSQLSQSYYKSVMPAMTLSIPPNPYLGEDSPVTKQGRSVPTDTRSKRSAPKIVAGERAQFERNNRARARPKPAAIKANSARAPCRLPAGHVTTTPSSPYTQKLHRPLSARRPGDRTTADYRRQQHRARLLRRRPQSAQPRARQLTAADTRFLPSYNRVLCEQQYNPSVEVKGVDQKGHLVLKKRTPGRTVERVPAVADEEADDGSDLDDTEMDRLMLDGSTFERAAALY